ncbi:hypothetical protein FQR65_LT19168 [Abscondita terminalis]|nr:hypothetical protein FQR65_LT19168 [Abscondita terminalis]
MCLYSTVGTTSMERLQDPKFQKLYDKIWILEINSNVNNVVPIRGAISRATFDTSIGVRALIDLKYQGQPIPYASNVTVTASKTVGRTVNLPNMKTPGKNKGARVAIPFNLVQCPPGAEVTFTFFGEQNSVNNQLLALSDPDTTTTAQHVAIELTDSNRNRVPISTSANQSNKSLPFIVDTNGNVSTVFYAHYVATDAGATAGIANAYAEFWVEYQSVENILIVSNSDQILSIVITGGTRGIGLGLAEAFLKLGWSVMISARNSTQLNQVVADLGIRYSAQRICGVCCDVAHYEDLQKLWDETILKFGQVNVWINNAENVIKTNVLGTMLGSQVALKGMAQQGFGQIFNMEGWGSRGEWSAGMTPYATSKRAVAYLNHALNKEAKQSNILIGTLSPGMVATDLLISSWQQGEVKNWHKMKWLFMFVIDPPEQVCGYLAKRISQNNKRQRMYCWMNTRGVYCCVFSNLIIGKKKSC